jgi:SNF2 family DNA or RNA helicase
LAFISTRPEAMPTVIVTPLVTIINWEREIKRFLSLTSSKIGNQLLLTNDEKRTPVVFAIRSGNADGKQVLPPADFYLINYEIVGKRIKDLLALNPKTVIWDEIHSLRNDGTDKYKACEQLSKCSSVVHRIGLSGTPIYNHGTEMFNILNKMGGFNG